METRVLKINENIEKLIALLGGESSKGMEKAPEFVKEDISMPEEEKPEHEHLPKQTLPSVTEEEPQEEIVAEKTAEQKEDNEEDYETAEDIFKKAAQVGLSVRQ
ncbi:Oidioi.mRNA.OKI2018_I69.chr1.g3640.t1.cds [Oikopleura dioica]|uniref:Oidioi.mRNA.OKI2018_I69.chr1.g3638.t1.cds n=1 Tax=Oikopleura dioica TaxID=34765 RepID=A0ABN7SUV4_OIKDI|nr:Oidioi.mRNA.OKI2018_I69.chr1.g3638.t1.cds [Oikopleura dioica]CAG5108116.1 Oidioi.mRNA.OKI2018_I69.chr1.g3640.t1.cds [Oikopleura dioica]